jgi:hypothetical protein
MHEIDYEIFGDDMQYVEVELELSPFNAAASQVLPAVGARP